MNSNRKFVTKKATKNQKIVIARKLLKQNIKSNCLKTTLETLQTIKG